jgi:DNA polymerase-3 subunit alpha
MPGLIKYGLLPEDTNERIMARRVFEFNRYLKAITKADQYAYKDMYSLDTRALSFLREIDCDDLMETDNLAWFIKIKTWDKVYQKYMDVFRDWIATDKDKILNDLNTIIFQEDWNKYAQGSISAWEMEVLCFYYHEHELANIDQNRYGFADFNKLSEDPVVDRSFVKGGKEIKIFKLDKICGTCIAKNKTKSTVTLLTTTGVVNVKFRKEYFSLFDKQISVRQEDGTKKIVEKSWFNRGNMIVVTGMRSGDDFISKKYASTGGHQLYRIEKINTDGTLVLKDSRYQGGIEEDA